MVRTALRDPHWALRKHGVKLAERFLSGSRQATLLAAGDDHAHVRFQAVLMLGNLSPSRESTEALARAAESFPKDPWIRMALLSAPPEAVASMAQTLLRDHPGFFENPTDGKQALTLELSRNIGARRRRPKSPSGFALLRPIQGSPPTLGARRCSMGLLPDFRCTAVSDYRAARSRSCFGACCATARPPCNSEPRRRPASFCCRISCTRP